MLLSLVIIQFFHSFQNACEILLERLEPYKMKNPDGTWEDWVNSIDVEYP